MSKRSANGVIHLCSDRFLSPDKRAAAARLAIRENPRNLPSLARIGRPAPGTPIDRRARMAILTGVKWENGRTLRIAFIGGSAKVRSRVEEVAKEWEKHANIELKFDNSAKAEIRISFDPSDGSWSYMGTDALSIAKNRATMNYGWLEPDTPQVEYNRVVLHEFGHALGCIHEHSHPKNGIPWDKKAVYAYYKKTDGWPPAEVDDQVFARYSESETNFSEFDSKSIMLYPIPNELTIGDYEVGWNSSLSATDKAFIGRIYPKSEPESETIHVDGPLRKAAIGSLGEEDRFSFKVSKAGRFEVQTKGKTDVVLMLLGPDSDTRLVAEDDDSGAGHNPRIREMLMPGTYYARVRHYSKKGMGTYEIGASTLPLTP